MIIKFMNPILLFDHLQRKISSRLENQAVGGKPSAIPVTAGQNPASEIRKIVNGTVVTFEGTYQGKPIRVRIFNENKGSG